MIGRINPATPNVVGGNRDVLDFPMWFAMRTNFTADGTHNNWYNVRNASFDGHDDGLANNGSQGVGFVINHDDGKGNAADQNNDYIVLDNVAATRTRRPPAPTRTPGSPAPPSW